jgi:glycosyltransferase involved in cell wall biosynthesis
VTKKSGQVVGIDAHVLTGKYQGSRTWLQGVLGELPPLTPENSYIIYSRDPAVAERVCSGPNVEHRRIPIDDPIRRLLLYWPLVARRDRLDVLLTQYIAPPFFARRQVVVVHDILFESHPQFFPPVMRWRNRLLVRASVRRAARVLTVSRFTRDELVRRYRVPSGHVLLAPNAVPPPVMAGPRPVDGPYVLFVGRIEPRKNLDLLLDSLELLDRPGLHLVVVGRPDFGAASTARRLADNPRVVHRLDIPAEELAALYCHAAVLVFPSQGEGFGLPVLEALRFGTPVVCSNTTALPEVAGAFARYFNPLAANAVDDLAQAIAATLDSPLALDPECLAEHLAVFTWRNAALAVAEAVSV